MTVIVLLLGLFAVPVSCAEAFGPHSLFAPPDGQEAATTAAFHAHHPSSHVHSSPVTLKLPLAATTAFAPVDALRAVAAAREPLPAAVDALPETGAVVAVAIMAFVDHGDAELPSEREGHTFTATAEMTGRFLIPDAPPPR